MIELQVVEEVNFDDALFSISFQMTDDEDAAIRDNLQVSHSTSSVTFATLRRMFTSILEHVLKLVGILSSFKLLVPCHVFGIFCA
jgi:hypothetical protein